MDKKIVTIYGILAAMVFIGLLMVMFRVVFKTGQQLTEQMTLTAEQISSAELDAYHNQSVTGDVVISFIKGSEYVPSGKTKLAIYLNSKTGPNFGWGTDGKFKGYDTSTGAINPISVYKGEAVVNKNGVVVGIIFKPA